MENLLQSLEALHPLSDALREHLLQHIKMKSFARNEYLLKEGRVAESLFFIKEGCVRSYYTNIDGNDVSIRFAKKGDVIYSVTSTMLQKYAGKEMVQALEETETYYLTYQELTEIYNRFPESNYIGRVIAEYNIASLITRLYILQLPKAIQRYIALSEHFPELVLHVPLKYIASYLGITEQSLSRIRNARRLN